MLRRLALLVLALGSLACGEDRPSMVAQHPVEPATDRAPEPAPAAPDPRDVTFVTSDGVTIAATLAPAATPDAPAVILVHQVGSTRAEWAPLVARLHESAAFTTLAIDLRGHGLSVHGPEGNLGWEQFDEAAWAATQNDVRGAVAYLTSEGSGVAPTAIAAVGASIGSSAIIAASVNEPRLATLVALSPGRAYHGFDVITPATHLAGRSILAIVGREETDNVETAEALGRLGGEAALVVDGDAHGVVLFGVHPDTLDATEDFLRTHLAWPRSSPRLAGSAPPPITSAGTPAPAE